MTGYKNDIMRSGIVEGWKIWRVDFVLRRGGHTLRSGNDSENEEPEIILHFKGKYKSK